MHKELGNFIVAEINRNLESIRYSGNDNFDKFAAGRIKVLVDLLGVLRNCKTKSDFRDRISMMNKSAMGETSILEEIDAVVSKL